MDLTRNPYLIPRAAPARGPCLGCKGLGFARVDCAHAGSAHPHDAYDVGDARADGKRTLFVQACDGSTAWITCPMDCRASRGVRRDRAETQRAGRPLAARRDRTEGDRAARRDAHAAHVQGHGFMSLDSWKSWARNGIGELPDHFTGAVDRAVRCAVCQSAAGQLRAMVVAAADAARPAKSILSAAVLTAGFGDTVEEQGRARLRDTRPAKTTTWGLTDGAGGRRR